MPLIVRHEWGYSRSVVGFWETAMHDKSKDNLQGVMVVTGATDLSWF